MVTEQDALAHILQRTPGLPMENARLLEALGRFAAGPVFAKRNHPAFANAVVDGYAVRSADGVQERRVTGEQPAGADRGLTLGPGEAIRIFTGAPLPAGTDAVVMQEEVTRSGERIVFSEMPRPGGNIRWPGADLAEGQLMLGKGQMVTAQMIGLLAGQGLDQVPVCARPRVVIISSGDELQPPGAILRPGEIHESNSWMLAALLQKMGLAARMERVGDDRTALREAMARGLAEAEVVLLSGGASVGDHDYTRPALAELGIEPEIWQVRVKPGKPLVFAARGAQLLFGLPGNPVSAFVTFLLFVRPALLQMLGALGEARFLEQRMVGLAAEVQNPGDRPHYLRGSIRAGQFAVSGLQESHALQGLAQSDALLRLEAGEQRRRGETVPVSVW